jgi:hypothetical protein
MMRGTQESYAPLGSQVCDVCVFCHVCVLSVRMRLRVDVRVDKISDVLAFSTCIHKHASTIYECRFSMPTQGSHSVICAT